MCLRVECVVNVGAVDAYHFLEDVDCAEWDVRVNGQEVFENCTVERLFYIICGLLRRRGGPAWYVMPPRVLASYKI